MVVYANDLRLLWLPSPTATIAWQMQLIANCELSLAAFYRPS